MRNGTVNVTVPTGWSAPSLTGTAAGYTTASTGTVVVAGQVISVTGVSLIAGATLTITYGATGGGGPGATATAHHRRPDLAGPAALVDAARSRTWRRARRASRSTPRTGPAR